MTNRDPQQDTSPPDDDYQPLDTASGHRGDGNGFLKSILTGIAIFPTVPIVLAIAIAVIIIVWLVQ